MRTVISIPTEQCPLCNKMGEITIDLGVWEIGVVKRAQGEYIQDAFPTLSAGEREQLMTGIHSECWDKEFAGTEEEGE